MFPLFVQEETAERKELALRVHERLGREYGAPIPFFSDKSPLAELVSALLSHRTRNSASGRAYKELIGRFGTWEAVRDAPPLEVQDAVKDCTWPEQKGPRVQEVLRRITAERGGLSLDFLADVPVPEARAWLQRLPGVGPKTSAAVLLFSRLRRAALPVDSHHHRVARRLGLIGPRVDVGPAHAELEALLPADWGPQEVYDHHEVLMLHGQKVCSHARPACGRCAVRDLCPVGRGEARP